MKQECGRNEKSLNFETTTLNSLNMNSYFLKSSLASSPNHEPTSTSPRTYFLSVQKVFLSLWFFSSFATSWWQQSIVCFPLKSLFMILQMKLYLTWTGHSILMSRLKVKEDQSIGLIMKQDCGRDEKPLNSSLVSLKTFRLYHILASSSSQHEPTSTFSRTHFKVFLGLCLVLLILCNLLVTTANCMPCLEMPLDEKGVSACSANETARNICERCAITATDGLAVLESCCNFRPIRYWCEMNLLDDTS